MATIIGEELKKWKESLKISDLNPYDITVINIILENYDELIEAGGTAGAKRIIKFAELVSSKKESCDSSIFEVSVENNQERYKIKRINSLVVNSFRGFARSRVFDLRKQYVLLYGPNGSGKTSFSEALEYGLLGNIEEAEADHIRLATYIKNTSTNKGHSPIIHCTFEDGREDEAKEDYDTYRFAFIEKNRITDFSHISSLTAKNQRERMAALFGLHEFTGFVQGFTKKFDDRYLPTSSSTEQSFKEKKAVRDTKSTELSGQEAELQELLKTKQAAIDKLAKENEGIKTLQQAIDYYDNPENGVLTIKLQNKDKETIELIDSENFSKIKSCCREIKELLEIIVAKRTELANKALQVNYKQLYETISKLDKTDECPACGTSINKAKRDPYSYAKEKLSEYKEIDGIKQVIHDKAGECKTLIDEVSRLFDANKELIVLLEVDISVLENVAVSDIENYEDPVKQWYEFSKSVATLSDKIITDRIKEYNESASKKNTAYVQEVEELKKQEKSLVTLSTQLSEKEKQIKDSKTFITEFDKNSAGVLQKIQEEKKRAEYNRKIMEAYQKIIGNLYEYADKLPELIAQDLEDKIVDYYNVINCGDADFEMLSDISLPIGDSNRLVLTFRDGSSSDALQVLSEGHIKILGLSILLAKAIKDSLSFIIFDDVVNAIDDDHRNGVADLIMKHDDFKNVQIILSTHGEQFVLKLKDKLGTARGNKDAIVYKFLPADSLQERGVIVEYSDAKTPIEAAQKNYESNDLKDAASKCRQAMESISYNLWNKISRIGNGQISVSLRSPKADPDLFSIVEALIKKSKKISGMECIVEKLEAIKQQDHWRVLNKGTHFEDEQQEFERADVKNVLEILKSLDDMVRTLKIHETAGE